MRGKVELLLEKEDLKFGLVSKGWPCWHWFIGTKGSCRWIRGDSKPLGVDVGQKFYDETTPLGSLEDVEVMLFQGHVPSKSHAVWGNPKVRVVCWYGPRSRYEKVLSVGWKFVGVKMSHAELGGVSDGIFHVRYAIRRDETDWEIVPQCGINFRNTVAQVWHSANGGRLCNKVDKAQDKSGSMMDVISWENRVMPSVRGPTVYNKNKWARRRLTTKELSDVADMPAIIFKASDELVQKQMIRFDVPGKVLSSAIFGIRRVPELEEELPRVDVTKKREGGELVPNTVERKKSRISEVHRKTSCVSETNEKSEESSEIKRKEEIIINQDGSECHLMTTVSAKAVKSDDAAVPERLWDDRIWAHPPLKEISLSLTEEVKKRTLKALRSFSLRYWKRKVKRDFDTWCKGMKCDEALRDELKNAGAEAVAYAAKASWWEWEAGSAAFFWRWPIEYQDDIRVGVIPRFVGEPPTSKTPQPAYSDEETRKKVMKKVGKVVDKGYIQLVGLKEIAALMYMFDVPKGEWDIRMVYDGSKSGLNLVLFAPWFSLPTVDGMCRSLMPGSWCADNDYGEQFLNFKLHPELRKYCGVDLSQLVDAPEDSDVVYGMWMQNAMGLKPSPYASVQGALRAKRIILGNRHDPKNPFRWHSVKVNLPGSAGYCADLPWIGLYREDGTLAVVLLQYIDDLRINAPDRESAWKASSRIAKILTWLGLQDAARKRREPSQNPGAWAGASVHMDNDNVYKSVTQDRWTKTQSKIRWLAFQAGLEDDFTNQLLDREKLIAERKLAPPGMINTKEVLSLRGFLVYVARTYTSMVPYLKGMHHTIHSWRPGRDEDTGWKIANWKFMSNKEGEIVGPDSGNTLADAPKWVKMAPRFKDDMKVLMRLTSSKCPKKNPVRAGKTQAVFLVGDASGQGFGTSTWKSASKIQAEYGAWDIVVSNQSSNFREAYNFVLGLERMVTNGKLEEGTEIFIFTDNSTSESCFSKGSSSSTVECCTILSLESEF